MTADFKPVKPKKPPFLVRLLRLAVAVGLVFGVLALIFAAWANHRREGTWSLRVFDLHWWGIGRSEAQPYVDGAASAAKTAYQKVWGAGGMVDQAEEWLKHRDDPQPAATPATDDPATPPAPAVHTDPAPVVETGPSIPEQRLEHESAFTEAGDRFQEGLLAYQRAKPPAGGEPDQAALREAVAALKRAKALLDDHVPAYNRLPGKDLRKLADGEELQRLTDRFLTQALELAR